MQSTRKVTTAATASLHHSKCKSAVNCECKSAAVGQMRPIWLMGFNSGSCHSSKFRQAGNKHTLIISSWSAFSRHYNLTVILSCTRWELKKSLSKFNLLYLCLCMALHLFLLSAVNYCLSVLKRSCADPYFWKSQSMDNHLHLNPRPWVWV